MTPTNLQLATHYKLNKDTVQKWKKTRPEVYEALVNDCFRKSEALINKVYYTKAIEQGRALLSDMMKDAIAKIAEKELNKK